jgi:hypothetical protein
MLVRLLYASRAVEPINDKLIDAILQSSRKNNPQHGITGVLCSHNAGNVFLQVLEGGRPAVNQLYSNIVCDSRHQDVTLLHFGEVRERRFSGWRMGSVDLNRINLSTILRYSEKPTFDPFTMTGDAALALLEELIDTAAVSSRMDG